MRNESQPAFSAHLALGTISFALCFAAWGLMSAFAPQFRKLFELSATQSAALVAAPVLLGSLARIPMGMLTDRLGGRLVFSALMAVCALPAFFAPWAANFSQLLAIGFFLGLAGASFAVGIGYVSRWTPPAQQGGALAPAEPWVSMGNTGAW